MRPGPSNTGLMCPSRSHSAWLWLDLTLELCTDVPCSSAAGAAEVDGGPSAHYSSAPGPAQPTARQPGGADAIFAGLNVELKEAGCPSCWGPYCPCCDEEHKSPGFALVDLRNYTSW